MIHAEREKLRQLAELLIQHKAQLDYPRKDVRGRLDAETFHLTRSEAVERLNRGGRLMFDCSGAITCLYKWCGISDPNGLGFSHEGYTGTMLAHLPHYTDGRKARTGALVVFGPGTGEHVAMVIRPDPKGGDPLLFSHGFELGSGPILLSQERHAHHRPVSFLNVSGL
jgi:hypothetical protein